MAYGCRAVDVLIRNIEKAMKHQIVGEFILDGQVIYSGKSETFAVGDRAKLRLAKIKRPEPTTGDAIVDVEFDDQPSACNISPICPKNYQPTSCKAILSKPYDCKPGLPCPANAALLIQTLVKENKCVALNDLYSQACAMGFTTADVDRTVSCESEDLPSPK